MPIDPTKLRGSTRPSSLRPGPAPASSRPLTADDVKAFINFGRIAQGRVVFIVDRLRRLLAQSPDPFASPEARAVAEYCIKNKGTLPFDDTSEILVRKAKFNRAMIDSLMAAADANGFGVQVKEHFVQLQNRQDGGIRYFFDDDAIEAMNEYLGRPTSARERAEARDHFGNQQRWERQMSSTYNEIFSAADRYVEQDFERELRADPSISRSERAKALKELKAGNRQGQRESSQRLSARLRAIELMRQRVTGPDHR